ncbi:MAG: nicotinate phosphoribosyltransferase [Betaproteobacteria bacterium]|nr:nicotinate phosphoribosyltransferase [Betaproteobacteria bacterium]MDE2004038.1 nicotinate phosphoribosyltransferase [Betaproteobacteria bacterium]MDE2208383.1 nicotinate phosphoribosyltransferase [Betaproteobacteria bacterium]MDE2359848.1 nicotinate phosphoribosyltransferase [Betaproteobacteria bacterium]
MIITSLLDTDLYKFTMMQVVLHHFPGAQVEYRFKCRNGDIDLRPYVGEIRQEIGDLCALRFTPREIDYLRSWRFFKSDFVDLLGLFHLDERFIHVAAMPDSHEIEIWIKGPWLHTILFEVPVLSIVSEVYNRNVHPDPDYAEGRRRLAAKIERLNAVPDPEFRIADYGTRRRFARDWQQEVIVSLRDGIGGRFVGTSNVKFALDHNLTPLGTMAHEYLQACQAVGPRLRDSQVFAFNTWAREYRGDLGIALSDVCGMDAFLRDFDLFFCKLFDGVRHDSGDPFEWGEKLIAHYQRMRIDPRSKTMVFSDSLSVPLALRLFEYFRGRSQTAFGIGTNLTNDLGYEPLSIVIKMTRCNGQPVAKISDEPTKAMDYDPSYVAYLREVFQGPEASAEVARH